MELIYTDDESNLKQADMTSTHEHTITYDFAKLPTEEQIRQIADIYRIQGWWRPRDDDRDRLISRLIAGSHCFVIAADEGTVVGIGRAISDGVSDAYIHDVTVCKNYRNRGIGGQIIKILVDRLHKDGIAWIGLIAEPGSINLYRHVGFREMPKSVPMLKIEEP